MTTRYQDELNSYMQSPEGISVCDPHTLNAPEKSREFLTNRIWKTFTAGIDAGVRIERERIANRLSRLASDVGD